MRLIAIIGARPNFIKIAPLVPVLRKAGVDVDIAFVGSRTVGREDARRPVRMSFYGVDVPTPRWVLDCASEDPEMRQRSRIDALDALFRVERPDAVLLVGDGDPTLAAAVSAARSGVPVVHLEAGLRCGHLAARDEVNRVLISRVTAMHLAPSECALVNLEREAVELDRVHFVGNILAESVLDRLDFARRAAAAREFGLHSRGYFLGVFHCGDNVDDASRLASIIEGLTRTGYPTLVPDTHHLRHAIKAHGIQVPRSVRVVDPVTYDAFLSLVGDAAAVVTDSGGVQDEACIIGTPCVTVRDWTERMATVESGANRLCACTATAVCENVRAAAYAPPRWRPPSRWDRAVSQRVVRAMVRGIEPLH